jgi:hypothetical protein
MEARRLDVIAIVRFLREGEMVFSYEFPLPSASPVGTEWPDGVKDAIAEFRRANPNRSLFDITLDFTEVP